MVSFSEAFKKNALRVRDIFLSSVVFGLTSFFFLHIEHSVGSLLLSPFMKGVTVASSLSWVTAAYLGFMILTETTLRLQGRSEKFRDKLNILLLFGALISLHGAYYGLVEAGFKHVVGLSAAGALTAGLNAAYSFMSWALEPKPRKSEDISGLLTKDELEQLNIPEPKKKPGNKPAQENRNAHENRQQEVGRPATFTPLADVRRQSSNTSREEMAQTAPQLRPEAVREEQVIHKQKKDGLLF